MEEDGEMEEMEEEGEVEEDEAAAGAAASASSSGDQSASPVLPHQGIKSPIGNGLRD